MHEKIHKYLEFVVRTGIYYVEYARKKWAEGANRRTIGITLFCGFLALASYSTFVAPPTRFPTNQLIEIPEGTPLSDAANLLAQKDVLRSPQAFKLLVRISGKATELQAGDYVFTEPRDLFSVVRAITQGQYGLEPVRIVIPEGATVKEMATLFARRLERVEEESFIRLALEHEGYLFPDTYFFLPNARETTIIRTLRENFDSKIEPLKSDIAAFGRPLSDIIAMASLLEREARIMNDRRKIAGVLWRRLDKGMLLQVDAAFLYSIGRTTFDLTREDLQSDSPYNTYRYKGLPPTPIGNPSLNSIKAAITPIDNGFYFYLADHSGVTHYSKTYEEHLIKKRRYLGT